MNRVGERDPAERSGKAGRVDQVDDLLAASSHARKDRAALGRRPSILAALAPFGP